jgi:hypothetical protein
MLTRLESPVIVAPRFDDASVAVKRKLERARPAPK